MSQPLPNTTTRPLLVELLTEELPPKALHALGVAFADGIHSVLQKKHLVVDPSVTTDFATPRRLAVHISAVLDQAPAQPYTEKLMPAKVGLTPEGQATPALQKKLASKGLEHLQPSDLVRESDGKQEYLYANGVAQGASLADALQEALDYTLNHLPIPKVMHYQLEDGVTTVKFVRPAHQLLALWGADIVPVTVLGLSAGRATQGHRFMSEGLLSIDDADHYQEKLFTQGKVVASFTERHALIQAQLQRHAQALGFTVGDDPEVAELLNEVTALVEHPTVYVGQFEEEFLGVPPECLILTMRLNQKYFPLFEPETGKLTNHFLIVSNMQVDDPVHIVQGNERVVRPRLADAQFFFETDRKTPLADRVVSLSESVYHNKLGSQLQRIERVRIIARHVAEKLGADSGKADRAALLAKADLNSNMVAEFPELQGIMGAYYAQADGEAPDVVLALREQYRIRLNQPVSDATLTATVLFIAERLETLVGIWGIGLAPTGERDPYALRRAALGVISAFEQLAAGGYLSVPDQAKLAIAELLDFAFTTFPTGVLDTAAPAEVCAFIYERYRNLLSADFDRNAVDAVLALEPPLHEIQQRVQACVSFAGQPEAASLAAANKRIGNILRKSDTAITSVRPDKLVEPAERTLHQIIGQIRPLANQQFTQGNFNASLATLAQAKEPVDAFFNDVMVMDDNPEIRANRLALLNELHQVMNRIADISRLAQ